jgi:hypothetical protein
VGHLIVRTRWYRAGARPDVLGARLPRRKHAFRQSDRARTRRKGPSRAVAAVHAHQLRAWPAVRQPGAPGSTRPSRWRGHAWASRCGSRSVSHGADGSASSAEPAIDRRQLASSISGPLARCRSGSRRSRRGTCLSRAASGSASAIHSPGCCTRCGTVERSRGRGCPPAGFRMGWWSGEGAHLVRGVVIGSNAPRPCGGSPAASRTSGRGAGRARPSARGHLSRRARGAGPRPSYPRRRCQLLPSPSSLPSSCWTRREEPSALGRLLRLFRRRMSVSRFPR